MKKIKYLFEFVFIILLLLIFKIIGYKYASNLGEKIGKLIGPLTRSKKKIIKNLEQSRIGKDNFLEKLLLKIWGVITEEFLLNIHI